MKYLLVLIISTFLQPSAFSQCDSTAWAQPGTYELVRINTSSEADLSNTPIFLTEEQLCLIEESRNDYHIVFLNLDLYTKVKIYPKYSNIINTEK